MPLSLFLPGAVACGFVRLTRVMVGGACRRVPVRADPGRGRGGAGQGADGVVGQQVAPQLLFGQLPGLALQLDQSRVIDIIASLDGHLHMARCWQQTTTWPRGTRPAQAVGRATDTRTMKAGRKEFKYSADLLERMTGIEPAWPAWKAGVARRSARLTSSRRPRAVVRDQTKTSSCSAGRLPGRRSRG
jgi:hypothetical protein